MATPFTDAERCEQAAEYCAELAQATSGLRMLIFFAIGAVIMLVPALALDLPTRTADPEDNQ